MTSAGFSDLTLSLSPTEGLSVADEQAVCALFARSYRQADLAYLRDSLRRLRTIATAWRDADLVGFALSENRRLDLPRLPGQVVRLAGLICVADGLRRRGLMNELGRLGLVNGFPEESGLVCGRMAHPASFRGMTRMAGVVPTNGVPPTPWQQAVGQAVADAYGVRRFEPATFICRGNGRPIGEPAIEVDATAEEWELFRPVDRARGDSLLGIAWLSDPPPGW